MVEGASTQGLLMTHNSRPFRVAPSFLTVGIFAALAVGCSKTPEPETPPGAPPAEGQPVDEEISPPSSSADTARRAPCAPEDEQCKSGLNANGEKICGGFAGDTCGATEYCAYKAGEYCGAADASSTCQPRPEMCTQQFDPVCGCDNKPYGNACAAALAGVGVLNAGECVTQG